MATSILKRNNVRLLGNGGSQAIIFAHGFGSDQTAWGHQVAAFASNYRIVLFDHVGAGLSDFAAYSLEKVLQLAAEYERVKAVLQKERPLAQL